MKKFFLLFFIFLFIFSHTQYSYSLSANTELEETCLKTNELSKISLSCFNNDAPLKSIGFYFGCSRMLLYSIVTKKDGRIKVSHKKLKFDLYKIYFYELNKRDNERNTTDAPYNKNTIKKGPDSLSHFIFVFYHEPLKINILHKSDVSGIRILLGGKNSDENGSNLINEGIDHSKIEFVGNIMIDSFELLRGKITSDTTREHFNLHEGRYGVVHCIDLQM